jgi:Spy/CpxP family protein refolding chaperone
VTKLVVIFGFLMAFTAGWIVGVSRPQRVATISTTPVPLLSTRPTQRGPGELDALLSLRPKQKEQLKKIWSDMAEKGRKHHEERRDQLREQREQKVQALLSPDQKSKFEQVHREYDDQRKALDREMKANFQQAVEATKAVLDPDQKAKYEEWLSKRQWDRSSRGGDRGGDRGPGGPDGDRGPRGERDHDRGPGGPPPPHDKDSTRSSDAGATSKSSAQP